MLYIMLVVDAGCQAYFCNFVKGWVALDLLLLRLLL